MGAPLAVIEWDMVVELLWVAPLAALAVSITFSLAIMGSARATDARRDGTGAAALIYSVIALLSAAGFVAVVAFGIVIIINK